MIDTVSASAYRANSRYADAGTRALVEQIQADDEAEPRALVRGLMRELAANHARRMTKLGLAG